MKKILALCLVISFLLIPSTINRAENENVRLFFNGNIYELPEGILSYDDSYFFDAENLTAATGIKYEADPQTGVISIDTGEKTTFYLSDQNMEANTGAASNHTYYIPLYINGRLYFPFKMFDIFSGLSINYDRNKNTAYILPASTLDKSTMPVFKNISYDYTFSATDDVLIDPFNKDGVLEDGNISLIDKQGIFSAVIKCDKLDQPSMSAMRKYINDHESSDDVMFNKYITYKRSFFNALQDYCKTGFLYGIGKNSGEINMKVFGEYNEKIFGQDSHVVLYNIIKYDRQATDEETHIDITVPVNQNKCIYSINFTFKTGSLNENSINNMSNVLNSIEISGLPKQESTVSVFADYDRLDKANAGIYPDFQKIDTGLSVLLNTHSGYSLSYPSTFMPYNQNNINSSYDYKSFKMDCSSHFSVSVEPAHTGEKSIADKVKFIKSFYKQDLTLNNEGTVRLLDKEYYHLDYTLNDGDDKTFIQDYMLTNNGKLYIIRLTSRFEAPSQKIQNEFKKIAGSLVLVTIPEKSEQDELPFKNYKSTGKNYTFSYPEDWKPVRNISAGSTYDSFELKGEDFSGPVEVLIKESEMKLKLDNIDALKYMAGISTLAFDRFFTGYTAPYLGKTGRVLSSSIDIKGNVTYLYKLINYLDSGNRSKLCYSVDIISGTKIQSLFVSISDYMTRDGKIIDKDLNNIINRICSSFSLLK